MSKLTFEEAVERLSEFQKRGWRLGLDRMQEFLRRLGVDDKLGQKGGPQFIHVAGTNGKGSTVAFLQSMLVEQGYKTGAMYSPYVYDVRERVQIGRDLIPKEDFARLTEQLLKIGEELEKTEFGGPTEFEMKTALGFLYWAEQDVEWVALETGLGGRLDATNVVDPAVSVITSISYDHTHILGETLAEIATEKAGIIKEGRPVVVGLLQDEPFDAINKIAAKTDSHVLRYGRDLKWKGGELVTPDSTYSDLEPGLVGGVQEINLALAVAALEQVNAARDKKQLYQGASSASLPGRYEEVEYKGRKFILDGAHNVDAARNLCANVIAREGRGRLKIISARTQGHEVKPFYDELKPIVEKAYVSRLGFHRTMHPGEVIDQAGSSLKSASLFDSSAEALRECLEESEPGETILVTGSLYIVGEIGNLIRDGQYSR